MFSILMSAFTELACLPWHLLFTQAWVILISTNEQSFLTLARSFQTSFQIFPDFFSQIFPHSHISSCLPRSSSIYALNNFEFSTFTWPEISSIHPTWPTHSNHLSCKHSLIVFDFRPFRSSREKILSSDIIISQAPNYPCITSL